MIDPWLLITEWSPQGEGTNSEDVADDWAASTAMIEWVHLVDLDRLKIRQHTDGPVHIYIHKDLIDA